MTRTFKLVHPDGTEYGKYCGNCPSQAAKKAFSSLCKNKIVALYENAEVEIRECTRGSKKKKFMYSCQRVKLDDPVQIQVRDRSWRCCYKNNVQRMFDEH